MKDFCPEDEETVRDGRLVRAGDYGFFVSKIMEKPETRYCSKAPGTGQTMLPFFFCGVPLFGP